MIIISLVVKRLKSIRSLVYTVKPRKEISDIGKSAFIDVKRVKVTAGSGGNGLVHFGREPFKAIAPADGGNGGRGGNVWIYVVPAGRDLRYLRSEYRAERGGNGADSYKRGANGEDVFIPVPKGTLIKNYQQTQKADGPEAEIADNCEEELFFDTSDMMMPIGTKFLLAKGGDGGRGNASYSSPVQRSPEIFSEGTAGESRKLLIELKCIADIGLVGLPNAGKSSFVRAVSRCNTRVGHWAFTTLQPHIATVQFPALVEYSGNEEGKRNVNVEEILDANKNNRKIYINRNAGDKIIHKPYSFTLADIPGIIKGAAKENRGLGHEFLRHIERSSLLVYVVDLSRPKPWEDLKTLVNELETYRQGMTSERRGMILANKADIQGTERNYKKLIKLFPEWECLPVSCKHEKNTDKAIWKMREIVEKERERRRQELEKVLQDQIRRYGEIVEFDWMKQVRGVRAIQLPTSIPLSLFSTEEKEKSAN